MCVCVCVCVCGEGREVGRRKLCVCVYECVRDWLLIPVASI